MDDGIRQHREFLKGDLWDDFSGFDSEQSRGIPMPTMQKPCPDGAKLIELVGPEDFTVGRMPLVDVIARRRSRRKFTEEPLSLEELSFLLWATQGVSGDRPELRTAASAGARQPFETYLSVHNVDGLEPGLYRYLPLDHKLCLIALDNGLPARCTEACRGQKFCGECAVLFIWTVIPARGEWRYLTISHKMMAIDAGHVCQNLYLAAESIGGGTCGIGAYDHKKMDALLSIDGVDGENEFTVYAAPVGNLPA